MSSGRRAPRGDGAERLLSLATVGLVPRWAGWGAAMRAELACIADVDDRRAFARSASAAAFRRGLGLRVGLPVAAGVLVAAVGVAASRVQLPDEGPGLMSVTVPVPALVVLAVGLVAAWAARSFRTGLETGALALAACFAAVAAVAAVEGLLWMDRLGVFVLDADPPRHPVGTFDVVVDIFTTGMWLGHVLFWVPGLLVGAAVGAGLGALRAGRPGGRSGPAVPATGAHTRGGE